MVGPLSYRGSLREKERDKGGLSQSKGGVVMEVEVVVMCFEDKEPTSQGMWVPSRIWAGPGNRFSLEPPEGASKSDTLILVWDS